MLQTPDDEKVYCTKNREPCLLLAQRLVRIRIIVDIDKSSRAASFAEIFEENARLLVELFERGGGGFAK